MYPFQGLEANEHRDPLNLEAFYECDRRFGLDFTTLLPRLSRYVRAYGEKPCVRQRALYFWGVPTIG